MPGFIETTLHPERYHGGKARPPFFEGWYFKLVSADQKHAWAVIPGVILGEDAHTFVQVLDGETGESEYYRYPLETFTASRRSLHLRVADNEFSLGGLRLALTGGRLPLQGEVKFEGVYSWPVSLLRPGVMGPFAWLPWMECYHGVLSFDHALHGSLRLGERRVEFSGGQGYIEKDWGRAFPKAWVWMQTNHFEEAQVCLTASVAIIPWLRSSFPGFIIGLWRQGKLYQFATYTGAQLVRLGADASEVYYEVQDRRYHLAVRAHRAATGLLKGPDVKQMGRRVLESLRAEVQVRLTHRTGEVIFEGRGGRAGMEVENVELLYK